MFGKLRLQLALVNLVVIFILLTFLTIGTYYFASFGLAGRADRISLRIADEINSGALADLPAPGPALASPEKHLQHHFLFVKTDTAGRVTAQSTSSRSLSQHLLESLVSQALQTDEPHGTINDGNAEYYYRKTAITGQPGTLIIFYDLDHERHILETIVIAGLVAGILCLVFSLLGSLFMANRALVPIRRAWQQQKDFLADASHELRTPLTVIRTNLAVIEANQDETVAAQNKWLTNIREEATAMAGLIDSLLLLARVDSQQETMDRRPFPLDEAVAYAAEHFEPVAAAKKISLAVSIAGPVSIEGDEGKIKRVIAILLDNAIKHTPENGKVSLQLTRSPKNATLVVADTGEGIAAEHLEKIFDRFYQVDKARGRGGSGLGLAIAKWIVAGHGGTIKVASKPGAGTAFTVKLPLTCQQNFES